MIFGAGGGGAGVNFSIPWTTEKVDFAGHSNISPFLR
jgi:hypothetical protein